jgi:hypothetical protein
MRKRTIAIPLSVLAAAGLAGGAYAASQSSSNPQQAFLNDAARRLHVSPARLSSALKQALIDRINAAVAAGHLTPAQARAIKQRIGQAAGLPLLPGLPLLLGAPGLYGAPGAPGPYGAPGPRAFGFHLQVPAFGPPGQAVLAPPMILSGAASYLGLTPQQLIQQLRSGKTLAQVASARGKSKTGLEHAMTSAFKSQLERAVKAGHLPRAFEQRLLQMFSQHVQDLVTGMRLGVFGPHKPPGMPPPGRLIGPPHGRGTEVLPPPWMRSVHP